MVSWIPVDVVAECVVDVCLAEDNSDRILNLAHPRPLPWGVMMRAIVRELRKQRSTSPLHKTDILVHTGEWALRFLNSRYNATWGNNIENIVSSPYLV